MEENKHANIDINEKVPVQNKQTPKTIKLTYPKTTNEIVFSYDPTQKGICQATSCFVDPKKQKEFVKLLKSAQEKMKERGIKLVTQKVDEVEWNTFLSKDVRWHLLHKDFDNTCTICCSIDNFGVCILDNMLRN